jgi:hypothetical protein
MNEIEAESRELVPLPPRAVRLSDVGPEEMVAMASRLATTLKAIVDKQKLYAVINNRKYPQVEAWMTIGRMDNVVAQEESVVRQDDGSYLATVGLYRLSDGSQVGRASAMCGSADDRPWNSRAEYNRRSMAVTRATSRAFRMQYSWIMALAGYEPTPAEEMPVPAPRQVQPAGTAAHAVGPTDNSPREPSPEELAALRGEPIDRHVVTNDDLMAEADLGSDEPKVAMTISELKRRASGAVIGLSQLSEKSKEMFERPINLLTNDERYQLAVELGLA